MIGGGEKPNPQTLTSQSVPQGPMYNYEDVDNELNDRIPSS